MKRPTHQAAPSDPLGKVVARVRVLSVASFEIDERRVETAPPLPRRFPPIPLIDALLAELYASAYCAAPGAVGLAEEPQAGSGADMLAALSAANASRTSVDDDWMVLAIDQSGMATVAKRGATRRVPLSGIQQSNGGTATSPVLGQLVSIVLPREIPEQGGFYFVHGEAIGSTLEGRPAVRFYWNVPADAAPELVALLTRALNAESIPFVFKCPRHESGYRRFDAGTLFLARPHAARAAGAIAEIRHRLSSRLRPGVPLFTKQLAPGLGFAEDPGGGESFGMARCRLLAEGFWTAFVRGDAGTAAILARIHEHLMLNGIDAERPYLNPWSVDRYDLGASP